jgi:single-strand DNA-binding protein
MITATIVGNVGKKPEAKTTKTGKLMCRFGVASTKKSEGREPVTSWVNVLCFDEQAEQVQDRVNQGDRVMVTGRLEVEKYSADDGTERTSVTLLADDIGLSLRFAPKGQRQADDSFKDPF